MGFDKIFKPEVELIWIQEKKSTEVFFCFIIIYMENEHEKQGVGQSGG